MSHRMVPADHGSALMGAVGWLALPTLAVLALSAGVVMVKRRRRRMENVDPAAAYRRAAWELKAENKNRGKGPSRGGNGPGYCGGGGCAGSGYP